MGKVNFKKCTCEYVEDEEVSIPQELLVIKQTAILFREVATQAFIILSSLRFGYRTLAEAYLLPLEA